MWELESGRVRFVVEHRNLGADGGPSLQVHAEGRQWLRFDCFDREPHWHLAPDGRDEIIRLDPTQDNVEWTIAELRRDLSGYLARAGWDGGGALDSERLGAALARAELELRNPPPDLDGVDLKRLRRRRGEKWQLYPDDVIACWVADMDFPLAEPIRRELARALELEDIGYPQNPTPAHLPTVFAERAAERWDWQLDPRRIEVMTDVVQGIYVGIETCSEPGDGALVQTPVYAPILGAVADTDRRLDDSDLVRGATGYEIDLDDVRETVDDRTRLLILCNPHNPTGRAFTRAELEGLAELVIERDLTVLSDEIHADLVYPGSTHIPFATLSPEVEARTITLTSATKAFSIAGLRTSVAIFGSAELQRRFLKIPRHVRGGVGSLGLAATEAAWRYSQPWLDRVLAYLGENRALLERFVREHMPGVEHRPPEATYLAWLDCNALDLPDRPHRFFLDRARVGLSDGRVFGTAGEGFVRLNFATSRAILTEILERMAKALQSHSA